MPEPKPHADSVSAASLTETYPAAHRRVSYLKLIALYKGAKGILLLCIGIALVFLDVRHEWLEALIAWAHEELILAHNKLVIGFFTTVEHFLTGDQLKTSGILALVYSAVLMIEGVGVWLEQRWAEQLMVVATAALIPLEVYHFWHKPTWTKAAVIVMNSLIVYYLYRTLQHNPAHEERRHS